MTWQKCKVIWPIKWSREEGCQLTWVLCSWWSPSCGCLCRPHRTLESRSEHLLHGRRHQLQTLGQWLNCIPECQLWIFLPSSLLSTYLLLSPEWPRRDMKMIQLNDEYKPTYRVSQNIGSTLFFDIFSGSGAHTEELLTIFQQPWKFAIW